ncbi:MAG: 2-polyprenyl-6-methoxyphenol hydroxylase [Rhizobacter sp.]|nr:2-polyprenyl-6-methoxyphenol hydroxylase [Rhizobacter sp.]
MNDVECEVLVVGGGPVGLALAGDLGWRGHHCLLVEQGDGGIAQAKMDGVGIRTMEFARRWGIVADVEGSAYNRDYPQDNVYLTTLIGWELGRQPLPSMRDDRPPPESPQKRERCPQNMFDPVLARFAASQPTTELRYGHQLLSYEQDDDGVTCRLRDNATQQEFTARARFLVGCDGGRSIVREGLGIEMNGKGVLTHTTNIIFRCPEFNQLHDKVPGYRYMFVGATGVWGTIVAINGRDQWRMSIIGNSRERPVYDDDQLKSFAHKAMGQPFELEILSVLRWTRIEQVADSYGRGRVYIAGDACHLTSPTGGLGMNTGIGDAVDLSWKLSACLEGWGGPRLLESYGVERRPIAHRITRFSTGNLQIMQKVGHTEAIFADTAEGAAARARVGHDLGEGLKREWFSKNMHLGNRYVGSPVCVFEDKEISDPDSASRNAEEFDDAVNYVPSTRPGCRAPHVWLADGRSTLDLFGRGFVLMTDAAGGASGDLQALLDAALLAGVPLRIEASDDPTVRTAYQKRFVLVRPDGHVAWRGDVLPAEATALLATVTGR